MKCIPYLRFVNYVDLCGLSLLNISMFDEIQIATPISFKVCRSL